MSGMLSPSRRDTECPYADLRLTSAQPSSNAHTAISGQERQRR